MSMAIPFIIIIGICLIGILIPVLRNRYDIWLAKQIKAELKEQNKK